MEFKKAILLSDTHSCFSKSVYDAINGHYSINQIYESYFYSDNNLESVFKANKIILNNKTPDLIIHAGDIGSQQIVNRLESISKLVAVNGNCDWNSFRTIEGFTKNFEILDFFGIKIAVSHNPYDLKKWTTNKKVDLLIHGHTHDPYIKKNNNGRLLICPGSASSGRYGSPNSIAAIYFYENKIAAAELIEV